MNPATENAAGPPSASASTPRSGPSLASRVLRVDAAGLLACAAAAAAAYLLGIAPVFDARAQVEEKRRLIDEQARNADDTEQLLASERSKQQALQRQLAETTVKLSPPSDLNKRLAVISELVEQQGLQLQGLDPGVPSSDPAIGKFSLVPIRLSGLGTFPAVSAFLHELLAVRYADMEVRTLSIAAVPPGAAGRAAPAGAGPSDVSESQNPPAEMGSFAIELRWYAAPAGSAVERAQH